METELPTIQQIKDALKAHIAEAEAATPGPWYYWDQKNNDFVATGEKEGKLICALAGFTSKPNEFTFIAHARTMSPAACKCLLLAIEGLEAAHFASNLEDYSAWGALESIRQEWHNLTK